jgi:hypothetical protein
MVTASLKEQIISQLDDLTPEQQQQVLDFTQRLRHATPPGGISGDELWERAHTTGFSSDDLAEIAQAIEEGCERIDWDGW